MPTLESLTVDELAALCGLTRTDAGAWRDSSAGGPWHQYVVPKAFDTRWNVWPDGITGPCIEAPTEHAALVVLAKHLNLTPKEDTVKYRRIERDPHTDAYPRPWRNGDVLVFPNGDRWTVALEGSMVYASTPSGAKHTLGRDILRLTTHIERPVKVCDVRGPDYEPKPGDVLCGPDGPLFVVAYVAESGLPCVTPVGCSEPVVGLAVAHFALATRIEREE